MDTLYFEKQKVFTLTKARAIFSDFKKNMGDMRCQKSSSLKVRQGKTGMDGQRIFIGLSLQVS